MKLSFTSAYRILLLFLIACLPLGTVSAGSEADVSAILGPMKTFPCAPSLAPGAVFLITPSASPLCLDQQGQIIGAVSQYGRGRTAVFAHTDYNRLNGMIWKTAPEFTQRLAKWLSKKNDPAKIRFLVYNDARNLSVLKNLGFQATAFYRFDQVKWTEPDFDILLCDTWDVPAESFDNLQTYVKNGGGLWTGCTPWAVRGLDNFKDFPASRLIQPFGLVFTNLFSRQFDGNSFVRPTSEQINQLNVQTALTIIKLSLPNPDFSDPSIRTAFRTLTEGLRWIKDFDLYKELPELPRTFDSRGLFMPLTKLIMAYENHLAVDNFTQPEKVPTISSSFPGSVPDTAASITRTVEIDSSVPRWASTGLYAPAGRKITISSPAAITQSNQPFGIRIGCHSDQNWHWDTWDRYPQISLAAKISEPSMSVCSAFGGLIYIEVPNQCSLGKLSFEISGAIPAPLYVLNQTTKEQWQAMKSSSAPWGELATSKIIISMPKDVWETVDDPEAILRRWDRILDADAELISIPPERACPERLVCDVQISAGWMHSGYPVMTPMPVRFGFVKEEGDYWGFYHEFGHNHQSRYWTFDGAGEVTVNWFTMYCFEKINGQPQDVPGGKMSPQTCRRLKNAHLQRGATWESWNSDPFLGLVMFVELKQRYGWDAYKKMIRSYYELSERELPKNEQQKRDRLMIQFSKAVNENLGPFFVGWGIPISQDALDQVKNLPTPK